MEIRGDVKRLNGCRVEMVDLYNINSPYNVWDKFTIKEAFDDYFDVEGNDGIAPNWKTAKLILDEKFLNKFKTEDIAINCETEEEAKEFCNWMHENGLKWKYGQSYKDETLYFEGICYSGNGLQCNVESYGVKYSTIIKFKDCVIDKAIIETKGDNMVDYEYKVKDKTLTLKDILDRDPCTSEYGKFIEELVEEGYSFKEICKGSIKFNIEHLLEYETVRGNIDWFVKEGLVIEEKKFEPFTFNIEINTKEELISLLKHLNLGRDTVEHENDPGWDYDGDKYSGEFICNTWKRLDDIYDEVVE